MNHARSCPEWENGEGEQTVIFLLQMWYRQTIIISKVSGAKTPSEKYIKRPKPLQGNVVREDAFSKSLETLMSFYYLQKLTRTPLQSY